MLIGMFVGIFLDYKYINLKQVNILPIAQRKACLLYTSGSPAAEAVKAAVHFHAGRAVIVEWTADHAVSSHPDSIE